MSDSFSTTIQIKSSPADVWHILTVPEQMNQWVGEPDMRIDVSTNWQINSPILIRGFHHEQFENKGIVYQYVPEQTLQYSHLSSVSKLPDLAENYTIFTFTLTPLPDHTLLTLLLENFPTESIQKHLEFYWKTTLILLKNKLESKASYYPFS